jgi:hypothetical protein
MKHMIQVDLRQPGGKERADRIQTRLEEALDRTGEPAISVDTNLMTAGGDPSTQYWYVTSPKVWDEFHTLGGEV